MENKAWGMGNTPPRMNNATNGRPDGFHYKAKFLNNNNLLIIYYLYSAIYNKKINSALQLMSLSY